MEQPKIRNRKVMRFPQVRDMVGLSRTSIWRLEKDGKFPRRVIISDRTVGWYSDEIEDYINGLQREILDKTGAVK